MDIEQHFSAGGVVYRVGDSGVEIALCGRDAPEIWSLPKGTPEPGESVEETALREVQEETGLVVEVNQELGDIRYWFRKPGVRVRKKVTFYLMLAVGGSFQAHDSEFDRVEWFRSDNLAKVMTYPTELELVRNALVRLSERADDAAPTSQS